MAMTKVEAAKLTQDLLLRGVIETVVKESMLLQLLPFMDIYDNADAGFRRTNPRSGPIRTASHAP